MKSKSQHLFVCGFLLVFLNTQAQITTTTINYQFPTASTCFLNIPPGPSSPTLIGGLNHYAVTGGVDRTVNEIILNAGLTGSTTSFGIYYPFQQNYKYTISVQAMASSSTIKLAYSTSTARCGTSSSCSPGPYIIGCSADIFNSITNISNSSYTTYTLLNDYTPASTWVGASQLNYFLIGAFNSVNSIGTLKIKSIIITRKACSPPVINSVTALGNRKFQMSFTPPPNSPGNTYNLTASYLDLLFVGGSVIIIPIFYSFPNIGSLSPVTITLPPNAVVPKVYTIRLNSGCYSNTMFSTAAVASVNIY